MKVQSINVRVSDGRCLLHIQRERNERYYSLTGKDRALHSAAQHTSRAFNIKLILLRARLSRVQRRATLKISYNI